MQMSVHSSRLSLKLLGKRCHGVDTHLLYKVLLPVRLLQDNRQVCIASLVMQIVTLRCLGCKGPRPLLRHHIRN